MEKGNGSNDTQQIVPEILESLQFPDNELLTETFQTACQEQKRALEAENNSDGVKKQKGKKTVTCISPVNVRTEPNVSTSQVIGALTTGEEVEMLGKENGWYKISYEGKNGVCVRRLCERKRKLKRMIFSKKLPKQTEPAAF